MNLSTNGILDNPALYDLERRLVEDEQILSDYIQSRFEAYVDRHESEYKYIRTIRLEFFPYKYICDYRGRRPKAVDGVRRLSFIYCIKSRSARTRISLTSLTRAYENYLASSPRAAFIEVELLLVEDISGDLLPRFPLLGANRFISHYLVDTKVEWTRSGLLNYGLKRATGDAIAFCDVDFLFHRDFFFALEKTTARVDFDKDVLVVNCFETEGHVRDLAYSRLSPYGYMWVVGRRNATSIGGFNEEYKGHGFEDRDFEYRLVNSLGLAVVNSHCLDPSLAVLHFSHNVRTGLQERGANQNKFINIGKTASPVQHRWGNKGW
ncbi:MAG: glycosyltransferase [Candidatus Accumulibacter sp.]|nr:glycosyltransferase [Accumulibacter sp.]